MGMPRFSCVVGNLSFLVVPLSLIGTVCGWLYFVSEHASEALSHAIGERLVVKAMLAGLALAICGTVLPYTMFAGETQADVLMDTYLTIPAGVLIATGLVKAMLTPALINLGWRGGHFFPVIFSGVSLGYGLAILTGADPVFCVAVCTASTMGAVMRQSSWSNSLLMCFPLAGNAPDTPPCRRRHSAASCASSAVFHEQSGTR
ncbi:MAG: chloride channel protein [Collinsella aerofaciens]